MATNYVYEGKTLNYTNTGAAIASGAVVVVGNIIGIAQGDIAATSGTGVLAIEEVWTVPKVSGAVIAAGEKVLWDVSAGAFDDSLATPATGDVSNCCVAMEAAGNGVTTIEVKINVGVGTVA
jgi:predicted RecA/RadA family phage recombinase